MFGWFWNLFGYVEEPKMYKKSKPSKSSSGNGSSNAGPSSSQDMWILPMFGSSADPGQNGASHDCGGGDVGGGGDFSGGSDGGCCGGGCD